MELQILYPQLSELHKSLGAFPMESARLERVFVIKCSAAIKEILQRNAPNRTGRLRSSIHVVSLGLTSRVSVDAPYAYDVEYGTSPHVIYPVNKKALWWAGATHPSSSVHHPGTKATHFVQKSFDESLPIIDGFGRILAEELARLI